MIKLFFLIFMICPVLYGQTDTTSSKEQDTSNVIEDVKKFSQKDNFFSKALRSIFVYENGDNVVQPANDYNHIQEYRNKIIRDINVHVLDLFGPTVYKRERKAKSWIQKIGNSVHLNTREWLIKNALLFSENSRLDPEELIESERFLRQNNYIYDARIIVNPVQDSTNLLKNTDSVDVDVYVQDIWSISGDAAVKPKGVDYVSLKDINFLGFGSELSGKLKLNDAYRRKWNWDGKFFINNISHTYFSGTIYQNTDINYKEYGFNINRDFFSPVLKYAGGAGVFWRNDRTFIKADSVVRAQNLFQYNIDLWAGYSAKFSITDSNLFIPYYFNLSFRITNTSYITKPIFDTTHNYQDHLLYLGKFAFAKRGFYKDRYIFGLGKSEDIPVGRIFSFLAGYEEGTVYSRSYVGIQAGFSRFQYQIGYLYAGIQLGGFLMNKTWNDVLLNLQFLYISKMIFTGDIKFRNYLWMRFVNISNSYTLGEVLQINNYDGIRGLDIEKRGNKRFTINYESDFFLPFNFIGFNIALVSFLDLGLLSYTGEDLFHSKLYKGFGFGIRLKNEHLIFNSIQLMFGLYPGNHSIFDYFTQNRNFYQFNQFQFSKPEIISFK